MLTICNLSYSIFIVCSHWLPQLGTSVCAAAGFEGYKQRQWVYALRRGLAGRDCETEVNFIPFFFFLYS